MALEHDNPLHLTLKAAMELELSLTRELLSNLHAEESFLILQDHKSWKQALLERVPLLDRLKQLRLQRWDASRKLEPSLPLNQALSFEIFNLRDQLIAITERLNLQQSRNQHLIAQQPYLEPHNLLVKAKPSITKLALETQCDDQFAIDQP